MKNPPAILGKIAESTIKRVEKSKKILPPEIIKKMLIKGSKDRSGEKIKFHDALAAPDLSIICEVKKASPSKGIIAENFPWLEIAKDYEEGGAAAVSVLTEPEFFLGSDLYLREISKAVKIPTLRKDFIIDVYQLYEAKLWGAGAALLICALLEPQTLREFLKEAEKLELDCLVEIHNEQEASEALKAGARIIGINNRDLTTFNVDTELTYRLKKIIPGGIITVAESGINTKDDITALKEININAVLIGESLMRSADKKQFLRELISS